jgi:hypothetical protein
MRIRRPRMSIGSRQTRLVASRMLNKPDCLACSSDLSRPLNSVSSIWLVGFSRSNNKTNQIDQINQMDGVLAKLAGYPTVGKSAFSCIAKPMFPLILSRPDMATVVPLNWPFRILMQSSPAIESTT